MSNLFKGKIKCMNCGHLYNFKLDHGIPLYICGGYKNYGRNYCKRNQILESDLLAIVCRHLKHMGIQILSDKDIIAQTRHMEVTEGSVTIYYEDGSKSVWEDDKIVF